MGVVQECLNDYNTMAKRGMDLVLFLAAAAAWPAGEKLRRIHSVPHPGAEHAMCSKRNPPELWPKPAAFRPTPHPSIHRRRPRPGRSRPKFGRHQPDLMHKFCARTSS